jgi:hypothetical protein
MDLWETGCEDRLEVAQVCGLWRLEDTLQMNHKEIGCEDGRWMELTQCCS